MPERFWEVVRELTFEEEAMFLLGDEKEADVFVEGAEYLLARDPQAGHFIGGEPPLWFMPMAQSKARKSPFFTPSTS
jgi:hypothetical protein